MNKVTGQKQPNLPKILPYLYIVGSFIGLIASFALTYDKIQVLKNPSYVPNCNINPIFSCGSIMKTEQASLFGVPNTIFGLMGYSVLLALGVAQLAGAAFKRWLWIALQLGTFAGLIFMHYLFFEGVFRINAICPYCFFIWMITTPLFWYTLLYNVQVGNIRTKIVWLKSLNTFLLKHHGNILALWYIAIFAVLIQHFWYYWSTLI